MSKAKPSVIWKKLRARALSLPEASEEFPWADCVVKVRKKIFVFLGDGSGSDARISLKLYASNAAALGVPGAVPTPYGLGKSGWVTIPIGRGAPPVDVLEDWITESYLLVAPKKLDASIEAPKAR
ncbi:MAG: MmcQ/YjbR family DNA-binding protein [Candidatus Eremiobacteraeota bacterium]|nr:MmcQ/YjbR family DNA-binding protein [Candidatus Eremiobacteraeota bacterium]